VSPVIGGYGRILGWRRRHVVAVGEELGGRGRRGSGEKDLEEADRLGRVPTMGDPVLCGCALPTERSLMSPTGG
jgi:hypothetical protein